MTRDTLTHLSGARVSARYRLGGTEAEARAAAALVCIDQTVEASDEAIPPGIIRDQLVGRLERFEPSRDGAHEATISYPVELLSDGVAPLLNLLFGISSLRPGIRLLDFDLPPSAWQAWPGPRFGREGLRKRLGAPRRPLVCGVLKPVGLALDALAELAYRFALGGLDLVKDDQALGDQAFCPFDERVRRCAEAVARANRETGRTCLYLPHVTGPWERMRRLALTARAAGAGGLLVAPGLAGFEALRDLARDDAIALPIVSHPALLGSFVVSPDAGMAPAVVFGKLPRLAGADASLYPIYDAGFPMSQDDCRSVARAAGEPWHQLKPIFPSAAGRMGASRLREICLFHGPDVLFVLGSSIQADPAGLVAACRAFMDELARAACP